MPGFGRATRNTRPNLCGHSVGWLMEVKWRSASFPGHDIRPESSACMLVRECPGSGGPGGKPAQAVVGIRLVHKSVLSAAVFMSPITRCCRTRHLATTVPDTPSPSTRFERQLLTHCQRGYYCKILNLMRMIRGKTKLRTCLRAKHERPHL